MSDTLLLTAIGGALTVLAMLPFLVRLRKLEHASARRAAEARRHGLDEPLTLHPVVDPERCIGSGGCVAVCPEQVLGIRHGQAVALAPAACIGHGLCERTCPTEAIRLVFGTATRGVDLPRIRENFETNVPGLYIIGELGGMGLIRNAFEQGRQCIEGIVREGRAAAGDVLDVLVVGCGPAGLSAGLNALHHGLRHEVLEREDEVGGTVRHYPRKKVVMTAPVKVPGYGRLAFQEIGKEELVALWQEMVGRTGLRVRTGETVQAIQRHDGTFTVRSDHGSYRTARVVLAIGRRGTPRRLGVPGEDSACVAYSLLEPEVFRGDRAVVVGGGDSAVEAALALGEQPGTHTWLAYRGDRLSRVKPANRDRFDAAVAAGRVEPLWHTTVEEIEAGRVVCRSGDDAVTLPADRVFVFIGGQLPTAMLRDAGVEIETRFGEP